MTRRGPARSLLGALAVVSLLGAAIGSAGAAGRRPYGGSLRLPVRSFDGLEDPHVAWTHSERLSALVAHCRLFTLDADGHVTAELAVDRGVWRKHTLTLDLVDGARFHDGRPVLASDVQKSFERLRRLGTKSPLAAIVQRLGVRAISATRLAIRAPKGTRLHELRRYLGRASAAVLQDGVPGTGHGCGAFVPSSGSETRRLAPSEGHPRGRPFLDEVLLRRFATPDAEVQAFVFGELDLSFVASPRYRALNQVSVVNDVSHASVVGLLHPRFRGAEGRPLRRALAAIARDAPLSRHVDVAADSAKLMWPAALAPTKRAPTAPARPPRLPGLTIGFPEGDQALAELARALRDAVNLRGMVSGVVRAVPVAGLDVPSAASATAPSWDIALVPYDWGAPSKDQAAYEALVRFQLGESATRAALVGLAGWADDTTRDVSFVPVLHLRRALYLRGGVQLPRGQAGLADLPWAWVPR